MQLISVASVLTSTNQTVQCTKVTVAVWGHNKRLGPTRQREHRGNRTGAREHEGEGERRESSQQKGERQERAQKSQRTETEMNDRTN